MRAGAKSVVQVHSCQELVQLTERFFVRERTRIDGRQTAIARKRCSQAARELWRLDAQETRCPERVCNVLQGEGASYLLRPPRQRRQQRMSRLPSHRRIRPQRVSNGLRIKVARHLLRPPFQQPKHNLLRPLDKKPRIRPQRVRDFLRDKQA